MKSGRIDVRDDLWVEYGENLENCDASEYLQYWCGINTSSGWFWRNVVFVPGGSPLCEEQLRAWAKTNVAGFLAILSKRIEGL